MARHPIKKGLLTKGPLKGDPNLDNSPSNLHRKRQTHNVTSLAPPGGIGTVNFAFRGLPSICWGLLYNNNKKKNNNDNISNNNHNRTLIIRTPPPKKKKVLVII